MKLRIGALTVEARIHSPRFGRCGDCHFWTLQWDNSVDQGGQCHRLAPMTDTHGRTLFPKTKASGFCGQFREHHENGGDK